MATVPGLPSAVVEADGPPGLDDEDNLYGHHEDNEQPVEEGQVADEDEENENPLAGDSDSEDEDIQVTIGDVAPTNVQFVKGPTTGAGAGKLDIDNTPILDGQTIYDMDLAQMEDRPWRKPGADLNDYFNYGFTEETWNMYCERQKKLRAEFGNNQAAVNKNLFGGINLSNPLAAVGTSVSHGYAGGVNRIQSTTTSTASGIPTLGNEVNKVLVDNGGNFHAGRHKEPVVRTVINPSQRAVPDFSKPPPVLIPPAGVPNTSAPPPGVDAPPGVEDGPPGTEDKPPGVQPTPLIDISMPPPGFNPNMPPPNMMGAGPPPARLMSLPPTNLPPPGFNVMLPPPGYPPTFGAPGTQPPGTQPPGTGMVRPLMDFDLSRRESGEFAPAEEGDDDHRRRRHHRRSRSRSTGRSTRRRGEGSRTERSERTDRDSEREERRRHRHRSRSGSKDREGRRKREGERKERSKRDEEGERKKRSRHDKDDDESRRDRDKERDRDRKRSRRDDRDRERGNEREREFREEECLEKASDSQTHEQDSGPPGTD